MKDLNVVFFGTPDFVLSVLYYLFNEKYNIVAVVTTPDKPLGRKQTLTPSPIKQAAMTLKVPILTPEKLNNEFAQTIMKSQPDILIVASYGKIIPQEILDIPKFGAINIHPSLLPKYRGPSPVQNAILNGDTINGVTIIKMDHLIDHGPILAQKELLIGGPHSTFESLVTSLFGHSLTLIPEAINSLRDGKFREQIHDQATFTKLIKKEDGFFDIDNPPTPEILDRMIRAYYPWPNVWTIWEVKSEKEKVKKIVKFLPEGLVQMEGKKAVKLADFLNGYPAFPIKQLQ